MARDKEARDEERLVLELLQKEKIPLDDLVSETGLSKAVVRRIIDKYTKSGHINAAKSVLDPAKFGLTTLAFITFKLIDTNKAAIDEIADNILLDGYVQEVHRLAGDSDIIVKYRTVSPPQVIQFIDKVKAGGNINQSNTLMIFDTFKETLDVPIDAVQYWVGD